MYSLLLNYLQKSEFPVLMSWRGMAVGRRDWLCWLCSEDVCVGVE